MEGRGAEKGILSPNQRKFLERLSNDGDLDIADFATELGVSRQTIYNYYHQIKDYMALRREKGKIELYWRTGSKTDLFYERLSYQKPLKEKVAECAVKHIRNGDVIFLDCGTAVMHLADCLMDEDVSGLTVVTANPYVMWRLMRSNRIRELYVVGGKVNADLGSFSGQWVNKILSESNYRFQKAFLGADGLTVTESDPVKAIVTISNADESDQKNNVIRMASETFILLDESKIGGGGLTLFEKTAAELSSENITFLLGCDPDEPENVRNVRKRLGNERIQICPADTRRINDFRKGLY